MTRPRDPALGTAARWRPGVLPGLLLAVLSVAACGQQTPEPTAAGTSGDTEASGEAANDSGTAARVVRLSDGAERPRMVCPSGERAMMIADFVPGAKGAPTPEEAVGLSELDKGEQLVISASGARAWVLRADGTARERLGLLEQRGWLLSERESCA